LKPLEINYQFIVIVPQNTSIIFYNHSQSNTIVFLRLELN
jgi:hypothetical protein